MNCKLNKIDIFFISTFLIISFVSKTFGNYFISTNYLNIAIYLLIAWRINIELDIMEQIKLRVDNGNELFFKSIKCILRKTSYSIVSILLIVGFLTVLTEDLNLLFFNIYHYLYISFVFIIFMVIVSPYFKEEKTFYITMSFVTIFFTIEFLNTGVRNGIREYLPLHFSYNINFIYKTTLTILILFVTYISLRKWKNEV